MAKQKPATVATGKGKGALKTGAKAVIRIKPMAANVLAAILQTAIAADETFSNQYTKCTAELRADIPSGLRDNGAAKEYQRRLRYFANGLAKSRGVEPESIIRAVNRYNSQANWVSPKMEQTEGEQAEAERRKEANRKALSRAKAEIKKSQPKIDPELLDIKAKELVKEKREAETEQGKMKTANGKAVEVVRTVIAKAKEGLLGDASPQHVMEAGIAFIAAIEDLLK